MCGCGEAPRGHATEEAAVEFAELRDSINPETLVDLDETQIAALRSLIRHFAETADARYCLPTGEGGYNMLHLACFFKKPELARCLLIDGADPNARATDKDFDGHDVPGDTPLSFALTEYGLGEDDPAVTERLLEVLVAGGADLRLDGPSGTPLLIVACRQSHESVLLKLLDLGLPVTDMIGVGERSIPCTAAPAANGWSKALVRLLDALPHGSADNSALNVLAEAAVGAAPGSLDCMKLLIARGADVNAPGCEGETPLYAAAKLNYELRHSMDALSRDTEERCRRLEDAIALLLREGADPLLAAGSADSNEFPGFTAADFIASSPQLLEKLRREQLEFTPPTQNFSSGIALLSEICRYSLYPDFRLRDEDFDRVAAALTPTPEMAQSELCEMAIPKALAMLARHDPERCAELIQRLPLWQHPSEEAPGAELCHHLYALLVQSIRDTPDLVLPADFIKAQAEKALAEDDGELSALLLELLARCPDAEPAIEPLLNDERLPLAAGAWRALLLCRGLPTGQDQNVQEWLNRHGRTADSEVLARALRLSSLQELWFGKLSRQQIEQLLQDIAELGIPRAETFYRELSQNLDRPDKLDELAAGMASAAFELEMATSRYIFRHADAFLAPISATASEAHHE